MCSTEYPKKLCCYIFSVKPYDTVVNACYAERTFLTQKKKKKIFVMSCRICAVVDCRKVKLNVSEHETKSKKNVDSGQWIKLISADTQFR